MQIGISQPTFIPWAGYFGLIDYVDQFVFLDDVQFDKRSWQQRNYISLNNQDYLLTIPVLTKGKFDQKIKDVKISDKTQKDKILKVITYAYRKKNYFESFYPIIEDAIKNSNDKLIDLNLSIIKSILKYLNINTNLLLLSKMDFLKLEKKQQLIFVINKKLNASSYISTYGAKKYLGNLEFIPDTNIKIKYFQMHNFNVRNNNQHLSIIDLIFNEGENSINYIRKSFKLID
jgi:hypothetical protein